MASIKDLRKRISSVKNTQQTTRAMKLVSAAKLRRAQEAIVSHRPYSRSLDRMLKTLALIQGERVKDVLLKRDLPEGTLPKVLLVVITSDRGLCGSFNSTIIRAAERWANENKSAVASVEFAFVGRRGHDFFRGKGLTATHFEECGARMTFAKARKLSDWIVAEYSSGRFDEVRFVYNEFKNAISQVVQVERFLPLVGDVTADSSASSFALESTIVKPSTSELFHLLLEKHFAVQAYRILLESQASEHGARMTAMENSTRNAGEMIRKLSLAYNKQRQANITKELLEIISGSESQKQVD